MRIRAVYMIFGVALALFAQTSFVRADVITIRTGQVGGVPGTCGGLDDTFHTYTPQTVCGLPILSTPFSSSDFSQACAGPQAVVVSAYPLWAGNLPCDLNAQWIDSSLEPGSCFGTSISVLYCAPFTSRCTIADSVKVCWEVDDFLGDAPSFPGPNPDGVYVNGVSLGAGFDGGNRLTPTTAVAYNVPLVAGTNQLEIYQRDAGCAVAGVILSATIYTNCHPTPVRESSWGSIKTLYR